MLSSRSMVLRRVGGVLTGLVATMFVGAVAASPASADYGPGYFSTDLYGQAAIFSDPASQLGGGVETEWTPAFGGLSGYPNDLTVNTSPRAGGPWYFEFHAPTGQTLQPGVYDDAGPIPGARTATLSATDGGLSCPGTGRFEIKDLTYDASGVPTRFWVLFELDCGSGVVFGELRFGEPSDDETLQFTPSIVRWPAENFWAISTPVPVLFTAAQSTTIAGVAVTGDDENDFRITRDGCTGLELAAGAECSVWVDFDPLAAGTRTASLTVTDASGATHSVPLQGFAYGGTTRFIANSDPGDQLAGGNSYTFSGPADDVSASGTPELIRFAATDGTDGFQGEFAPPAGQALTTGSSWTDVSRYPYNRSGAGMDIDYDEWGCNTVSGQFKVISATYDPNGQLTSADITYQQRCGQSTGVLHGELQWRAGDNVAAAPWMEPDATGAREGADGGGITAGGGSGVAGGAAGSIVSTPGTGEEGATVEPPAATISSEAAAVKRLATLTATLSRDNRQVDNAVRQVAGRVRRSRMRRALRSLWALQAAVTAAQASLRGLVAVPFTSVQRALRRLTTWRTTLTIERRVLSRSQDHIPASFVQLVVQGNSEANAAIRTLVSLRRYAAASP